MTYQETVNYLFEQLPMFQRIGAAAYKGDLKNTLALDELTGFPHRKFKTIHVAGTNGKGSVSHMIASVLQTAGYKTGLYTSPHLLDFRERIRINGQVISEAGVIKFVEKYHRSFIKLKPSFFEITVAMAFDWFREQEVDIAVIEVGLGGRLDSTNIITPLLSVITNISFDHTQFLGNTLKDTEQFQTLANAAVMPDGGKSAADLGVFAVDYIKVFSTGFNYAFGIAAGAMVLSLVIYLIFNKFLPSKHKIAQQEKVVVTENKPTVSLASNLKYVIISLGLMAIVAMLFHFADRFTDVSDIDYKLGLAVGLFVGFVSLIFQISTKEEKPRVVALTLVFVVVIFFRMSFHQNGLTLTMFARDYTTQYVGPFTNLFFDVWSILSVIASVFGAVLLFFNKTLKFRIIGAGMFFGFAVLSYLLAKNNEASNLVSPEVFQSFNPLFIVALTPPVMGVFAWLNKNGKEPSSPRKIGIGMIIAALGFILILVASLGLVSPKEMAGAAVAEVDRVSPYWLMSSYLVLTIAELFLSPIGLSFVAKVAPPRFQGLMQGGWLLATAVGNKFLFVGSLMWGIIDLYMLWGIFIVCCFLAAIFIFSIIKRLEKATS